MTPLIIATSEIGTIPRTVGRQITEKSAVSGELPIVARKFGALGSTAMVIASAIGILKKDTAVNINKHRRIHDCGHYC